VENPYWQLFCGESWFQHHPPIDSSSLTRWRQRIGAEGMEWLLAQTIKVAASAKVIKQHRTGYSATQRHRTHEK